jgi:hypothetical protein
MLSDTFAGIAPGSVGPFLAAQVAGTLLAVAAVRVLYPRIAEVAGAVVLPHTEPAARSGSTHGRGGGEGAR